MAGKRKERAFTMIELLVVVIIIGILISLLLPAVQAAREAARRIQCVNNLMQIGFASKSHEEAYGVLPMGVRNEDGPIRNVPRGDHMGWFSRILPYMEQTPLYNEIDMSQSVYSEKNQPVWLMPGPPCLSLSCPSDPKSYYKNKQILGNTNFMACSGGQETPIDSDNGGVFFLNSKLRSRDIQDGTSNTIYFGESRILNTETCERIKEGGPFFGTSATFTPENNFPEGGTLLALSDSCAHILWPNDWKKPLYARLLGWMTGTPATIRNTGNPINILSGPFGADDLLDTLLLDKKNNALKSYLESYNEEQDQGLELPLSFPDEWWQEPCSVEFLVGGFSSYHTGGANFFMGDGSIRLLNALIDSKVYQELGNRNDSGKKEL